MIFNFGDGVVVVTFDTLEYAKNLEAKGFSAEQAQALAIENKKAFNELAETQLATKDDIRTVEASMRTIEASIRLLHWGVALIIIVTTIPVLKSLFV